MGDIEEGEELFSVKSNLCVYRIPLGTQKDYPSYFLPT